MLHTDLYIDTYLRSFVSGHVGVSRALYVVSLVLSCLADVEMEIDCRVLIDIFQII